MKAVVMAGGFGTRLRPLTCKLPKPMAPVLGLPMLEHIVRLLKKNGFDDIVILLYFQSEKIRDYLGDGSKYGVKFTYAKPDKDLGTAGAVKYAAASFNERFLIISGDLYTDFNLKKSVDFHVKNKADATMVLTRVDNPLSYGIVFTDKKGKIQKFLEKPTWGEVFSDGINTGIYILDPKVLEEIPDDESYDFGKDLFPKLLKNKASLWGYMSEGYWRDIGNLSEYLNVHSDFFSGKINANLPYKKTGENIYVGKKTNISKNAEIRDAIIGSKTEILDKCKIIRSVIGENCKIGWGVELIDAVIWDNTVICGKAKITNSTVAYSTKIGRESRIGDYVHIGENCNIGDKTVIKSGVKIWPDKMVEDGAVLSHSLVWAEKWQRDLFTAARVTGIANNEISPEFCAKLGSAYGAFIGEGNSVATSRDSSIQARMAKRAIICGVSSSGVKSVDYQRTPIPVLRQDISNENLSGAIHVRKSPKDKRLIDIIFFDKGGKDLPSGKIKSIEKLFFGEDYRRSSPDNIGDIDYPIRVNERYKSRILNTIDLKVFEKKRLKVILDYSFGMASTVFPGLLGEINIDVVSLNAFLDADKTSISEEEFIHRIEQLSTIVRSIKADVGFILNPNMEQIFAVDENGDFLTNDELPVIITKMMLDTDKVEKIAAPVNATVMLDYICKDKGVEIFRIIGNHREMMSAADTEGVKLVLGTRGGYIFPDSHFACDSIVACIKILELMLKNETTLSNVKNRINFTHIFRESLFAPWEIKGKIMRYLMHESDGKRRDMIDGIRIFENDVITNLIPSSIAPAFDIQCESFDKENAQVSLNTWKKKIQAIIESANTLPI
ncbi:sugar phosphate nucleotidyltransferase [candidate division KSB1 bacterium]